MSRQLLVNVGGLFGAMAVLMAALWMVQRQLIYLPSGPVLAPGEVGLHGVEQVRIHTEDGLSLSGWFIPAATPQPIGAVISFPATPATARSARPWPQRLLQRAWTFCCSTTEATEVIRARHPSKGYVPTPEPFVPGWTHAPAQARTA